MPTLTQINPADYGSPERLPWKGKAATRAYRDDPDSTWALDD